MKPQYAILIVRYTCVPCWYGIKLVTKQHRQSTRDWIGTNLIGPSRFLHSRFLFIYRRTSGLEDLTSNSDSSFMKENTVPSFSLAERHPSHQLLGVDSRSRHLLYGQDILHLQVSQLRYDKRPNKTTYGVNRGTENGRTGHKQRATSQQRGTHQRWLENRTTARLIAGEIARTGNHGRLFLLVFTHN